MGFRYRKSVKIMPGVRVNISKSGASVSVGRRGATTNFSKRGMRSTVGIPGTGLSYTTKTTPWGKRRANRKPSPFVQDYHDYVQGQQDKRSVSLLLAFGIFIMPYVFAWFTLRQGYSKCSRVVSFAWLVLYLSTFVLPPH